MKRTFLPFYRLDPNSRLAFKHDLSNLRECPYGKIVGWGLDKGLLAAVSLPVSRCQWNNTDSHYIPRISVRIYWPLEVRILVGLGEIAE
jgi:hypothetical protein